MTKTGHQLTGLGTAAIALALVDLRGGHMLAWLGSTAAFFGATAPDWLEAPYGWARRKRLSLIPHRTITHWLPLWVLLLGLGVAYGRSPPGAMAMGFALGGLVHLAMDVPNPMGIPVFVPNQRVSLRWWKSGQHEIALVLLLWGLGALSLFIPCLVL
ncbi:metal-dependent hydrolase [Thiomonas sp.]